MGDGVKLDAKLLLEAAVVGEASNQGGADSTEDPIAGSFYDESNVYESAEARLTALLGGGVTVKFDGGMGKNFAKTQSAGFTKTGEPADILELSIEKCFGERLCFYGGKVLETVGAEIIGAENPHTVRSLNFGAVPFSMTGAGVKIGLSDNTTLKLFLSLGPDQVENVNKTYNTHLNLSFAPNDKISGFLNAEAGANGVDDNYHETITTDVGLTYASGTGASVSAYVLSVAQQNSESNHWDSLRGANLYVSFRPQDSKVGVNLRAGHTIKSSGSDFRHFSQGTASLLVYLQDDKLQIRVEGDEVIEWGGSTFPRASVQVLRTFDF